MSAHTAGPWFAIRNDHYWEVNIEDCRYAPSVANTCDTEVREGSDIAEANARLIAAAPEMFDMLNSIENDGNQVPPWLWAKIQTVIKKAGGKAK